MHFYWLPSFYPRFVLIFAPHPHNLSSNGTITWRCVRWARQLQMRLDPLAAIHLTKTVLKILAQIAQNLREIIHIFQPNPSCVP
jgi:hypothetical protein